MRFFLSIITTLCMLYAHPQALPIYIDGTFNDWENASNTFEDETNDGQSVDFVSFSISNDDQFLFLKIVFAQELDLFDYNNIYLHIDSDNDASTGYAVNGIGSEMDWNFGQKYGYSSHDGSWQYIDFPDIQLRALPTVTSHSFEIAVGRNAFPDGEHMLFPGDTIKICFTDNINNGDRIPDEDSYFTYSFDHTELPAIDPILIEKENNNSLRLMTYNIQHDFDNEMGGLDDPARIPSLQRIFKAISPQIITLNECWNTTESRIREFLNENLPLENDVGWYTDKTDGANITASVFPIEQSWLVHSGRRITANLIDLPDDYATDILIINAHLKCCDGDQLRQMEVDAITSFLLDAKTEGGRIDLEVNTPFALMGDLNLVGLSQQLTTLISGDIQDTLNFGSPASPDWDESTLEDLISRQTDKRMAYTWRNDYGSYPPGRLDFMIYSNSVMEVEKAFTLQTEVMPAERLQLYQLNQFDTRIASDHFPKVADFILPANTGLMDKQKSKLPTIYPNPALNMVYIESKQTLEHIEISDLNGIILLNMKTDKKKLTLDISELNSGLYLISLKNKSSFEIRSKLMIMR